VNKELLTGALSNYYPYQDRSYNLDLNIRGKFTSGASLEGYFKRSSRIDNADYINIKLFDRYWECEMGNSQSIGYGTFSSEDKVIAIKGRVGNDKGSIEAGIGTPEGVYRFENFKGNNTQGPFQLQNAPVLPMTEEIVLVSDGAETALINGQDYTIEYRTGQITLNSILRDNQSIQIYYYSENWRSFSRLDYYAGIGGKSGLFNIDFNGGGVHYSEDSLSDTLKDYYVLGLNTGMKYKSLFHFAIQGMTSAEEQLDSSYMFSGTGVKLSGKIADKIGDLTGNYYRAFNDFKRIGESDNTLRTNGTLDANAYFLQRASIFGKYSKSIDENTDSRSIMGGGRINGDGLGEAQYRYSNNYNILSAGSQTDYRGHNFSYINKIKIYKFGISTDIGRNEIESDSIQTKYEKRRISINNTVEVSKDLGISLNGNIENREFEDSVSNIYEANGSINLKKKVFGLNLSADYINQNQTNIYSGQGNATVNFQKYINLSSKIKAEVNDKYFYADSSEPEIEYNISNSIVSNPISFLRLRYGNGMVISQGVESKFIYRNNISNNGNIGVSTNLATFNFDIGNGYFLNYKNSVNSELQSDNKRYYINSSLSPKQVNGYVMNIYHKYSVNEGLTMQYIQQSYSEEIDTVSYLITQKDIEAGATLNKSYDNMGNVNTGYTFLQNFKAIPDSIPVDAFSHRAYVNLKRKTIENLDLSLKVTGEKRRGIDPDIEQNDTYMDVIIISPEIGVYYSFPQIGNAGLTYSTSLYSGTSSQQRHNVGFNVNLKRGYFEISGGGNYSKSDYYTTLEYNIGLKMSI